MKKSELNSLLKIKNILKFESFSAKEYHIKINKKTIIPSVDVQYIPYGNSIIIIISERVGENTVKNYYEKVVDLVREGFIYTSILRRQYPLEYKNVYSNLAEKYNKDKENVIWVYREADSYFMVKMMDNGSPFKLKFPLFSEITD